jgi:hypothetical protein
LQIANRSLGRIAPPENLGSLLGGNWEGIFQKEMPQQEAARRKFPIAKEQMAIQLLP